MSLSVVFCAAIFLAGCAKAPPPLRPLPDFALTAVTVDGTSPLDLRALRGRAWVAGFSCTRCAGPYASSSADMAALQRRLPRSIGLLSFTVDPDRDSPEVLAVYARGLGADPQRWFFVAGDKPALARLLRDGFRVAAIEDADAPAGPDAASAKRLVLIDAEGRVRGDYDGGDPASLDRLAADAGRL